MNMKHSIHLSALEPETTSSVAYIDFISTPEEIERGTFQRLVSLWKVIEHSMTAKDVSEIVLVFQRVQTHGVKRALYPKSRVLYVRQFSGSSSECRKFTCIVKLMKILILNLAFNKSTSRRDIYYQDVSLFKHSQMVSNSLIDLVCDSLNLAADDDLLVHASQKGMIFGNTDISINTSINLVLRYSDGPQLIPILKKFDKYNLHLKQSLPAAIIVIEKDAVFKFFCNYIKETNFQQNLIVLTGKGFPDRATRKFLSALNFSLPRVPILGFMDSDVYGLSICRNYRMGNLKGETSDTSNITLEGAFILDYKTGWLDVSAKDFRMMSNFIIDVQRRLQFKNQNQDVAELKKWHREITRGLVLFKKSELNVVDNDTNSASQYILKKINSRLRSNLQILD